MYLYRAVDSTGATIDFLLSAKRDAAAAERFLTKAFHNGNGFVSEAVVLGDLLLRGITTPSAVIVAAPAGIQFHQERTEKG